jgi:hypothetical protein
MSPSEILPARRRGSATRRARRSPDDAPEFREESRCPDASAVVHRSVTRRASDRKVQCNRLAPRVAG